MSRSMIGAPTNEMQTDSGSVLWSFVQGEQLEFPVTLSFIENVSLGYVYEAVVVEGENEVDATTPPTYAKGGGIQTRLVVRVPLYRGEWSSVVTYHLGDVVTHNGLTYLLPYALSHQSSTTPALDATWAEHTNNVVYIRFPSSLSVSPPWEVQPSPPGKVYGFFELRVTENTGQAFTQTWKPMRGLVEIQYSPTEAVLDS
jgi:hypothetical protein